MPGEKESSNIKWDAKAILDGTMWKRLKDEGVTFSHKEKGCIKDIKVAVWVYNNSLKQFDELNGRYLALKESGVSEKSLAACEKILLNLKREKIEQFRETFLRNCERINGKEKVGEEGYRTFPLTVDRVLSELAKDTDGAIYSIKDNLDALNREINRVEELVEKGDYGELNTDKLMSFLLSGEVPIGTYEKYTKSILSIRTALTKLEESQEFFTKLSVQLQRLLGGEDVLRFAERNKSFKAWGLFLRYSELVSKYNDFKQESLKTPKFSSSSEYTTEDSIDVIKRKITPLWDECNAIRKNNWGEVSKFLETSIKDADAKKLKKSDEPEERKEEAKMPGSFQKRVMTRGRGVAPASKKSEDKKVLLPQINVGELMKLVTEGKQLPSLESGPRYVSDCKKAYGELRALYKKYGNEKAAAERRLQKWRDIGQMYEKIDSETYMASYMRAESDVVREAEKFAKQCESRIAKLLEKNTEESYADYLTNIEMLILAFQGMEAYNGYLDAERKTRALIPTQEQLSLAILRAFNLAYAGRVPASYETLDNRLDGEIKNSEQILLKVNKKSVSDLVINLEKALPLFPKEEDQKVFASFIRREYEPLKEIYSDCKYKIRFLKSRYAVWKTLLEQRKKINDLEIDLKMKDEERELVIPEKVLTKIENEEKKYEEYCGIVEKLKHDTREQNVTECVTSLKTSLFQIQTGLNELFESMQNALKDYYGEDAVYPSESNQSIYDDVLAAMQEKEGELRKKLEERQKAEKQKEEAAAAEQQGLLEQLSSLEKRNEEQKRNLDAKQQEIEHLMQEAETSKTKVAAQIAELQKEIETAKGQQKKELEKKEEELQGVRGELQKTQESLESQAKDLEAEKTKCESKETEISELQKRIDGLETDAAGKGKEFEEVSKRLGQLQTELDTERAKSGRQAGELEGVKSALAQASASLTEVTKERDTFKARWETEKSAKEKAEREAAELSEKLRGATEEFSAKQTAWKEEKGELEKSKKEVEDELTALEAAMKTLTAQKEALDSEKDKLSEKQVEQKKQLEAREQKLAGAIKNLEEAKKELETKKRELGEEREALAAQGMRIAELNSKLEELQKSLEDKNTETEEVNGKLRSLRERFSALTAAKEELERKSAERESKLDEIEKKLREVISENQSLRDVIEGKGRVTHDIEVSAREKAQQEAAELRGDLDKLNEKISKKEAELKDLQGQLEERVGQLEDQAKEVETLRSDLDALKKNEASSEDLKNRQKAVEDAETQLRKNIEAFNSEKAEYEATRKKLEEEQDRLFEERQRKLDEEEQRLTEQKEKLESKNKQAEKSSKRRQKLAESLHAEKRDVERERKVLFEEEAKLAEDQKALAAEKEQFARYREALDKGIAERFVNIIRLNDEFRSEYSRGKEVSKMEELSVKELLEKIESYTYEGSDTVTIGKLQTMVEEIKQIEGEKQAWDEDYKKCMSEVSEENKVDKQFKSLYEKFNTLFSEYNLEYNAIKLGYAETKEGKNAKSYLMDGLFQKYKKLKKFYDENNKKIDDLIEQLKQEAKLTPMTISELFNAIMKDTLTDKQIKDSSDVREKVDSIRKMVSDIDYEYIKGVIRDCGTIMKGLGQTDVKYDELDKKSNDLKEKADAFKDKIKIYQKLAEPLEKNSEIVETVETIYDEVEKCYSELTTAKEDLKKVMHESLLGQYYSECELAKSKNEAYWEKLNDISVCEKDLIELNKKLDKKTKQKKNIEKILETLSTLKNGSSLRTKYDELDNEITEINTEIFKKEFEITSARKELFGKKYMYAKFEKNGYPVDIGKDDLKDEKNVPEGSLYIECKKHGARKKELQKLVIKFGLVKDAKLKSLEGDLKEAEKKVQEAQDDVGKLQIKLDAERKKIPSLSDAFVSKVKGTEGRISRRAQKKEVARLEKQLEEAKKRKKTELSKQWHLNEDDDSLHPTKDLEWKETKEKEELEAAVKTAEEEYNRLKNKTFRMPGSLRKAEKELEKAKEALYEHSKKYPTEPIKYNDGSEEFAQEFAAAVDKAEKEAEEKRKLKRQDRAKLPDKKREKEEEEEKFADDRKYIKKYVEIKESIKLFLKEFPNGLPFLDQQKNNKILTAIIRNEAKQRDELGEVIEKGKDTKTAVNEYFAKSAQINALKSYFDIFFDDGGYLHELANSPFNKDDSDFSLMAKEVRTVYKKLWTGIYEIPAKATIINMAKGDITTSEKLGELCNSLSDKVEKVQKTAMNLISEMKGNLKKVGGTPGVLTRRTIFGRGKTVNAEAISHAFEQLGGVEEELEKAYKKVEQEREKLEKASKNDPRSIIGGGYNEIASSIADWIGVMAAVSPEPISKGVLGALSGTIKLGAKIVEIGDINVSWGHGVDVARSDLKKQLNEVGAILDELKEIYERIITGGTKNALSRQTKLTEAVVMVLGIVNKALLDFSAKCQKLVDGYHQFPCLRTRIVYHALWEAKRYMVKVLNCLMDAKGFNSLSEELKGEVPENRSYKIGF